MLLRLVTTISVLAAATVAVAEPTRLSNETLKATLTGALVEMDTPAGTVIPVRFGQDGLVSGKAGVLASVLGAAHDRGRWWAADDKLCVKWFRWFEAKTRCVSLRQDGTRIYWRGEDGRSGTGTIAEPAQPVVATAPTLPARAKDTTIELADTAPAPAVEPAKKQEAKDAGDRIEARSIRFAMAAFDAMIARPKVDEPRHVLDAPGRQAITAELTPETAKSEPEPAQATPPPAWKASATPSSDPGRRAPEIATAYASSPVVLASFRVARVREDDMLNVRSGPSEFYPPIGELPPEGRGVKIIGPCRADWCPIRYESMSGWVNRYFLAEETSGPAAPTVSR